MHAGALHPSFNFSKDDISHDMLHARHKVMIELMRGVLHNVVCKYGVLE